MSSDKSHTYLSTVSGGKSITHITQNSNVLPSSKGDSWMLEPLNLNSCTMRVIKNFLHIDLSKVYAVIINDLVEDEEIDPDWPEFFICEDKENAEIIKNTLNAISFKDCSDLLLSEEPYLTTTEIKHLWVQLKAAQYTVHPVNYNLLNEHVHRVPMSLKSLKRLIPSIELV